VNSPLVQLADALVNALNGHGFPQALNATRAYQPSFGLEELNELRVTVVPKSAAIERAARDSDFIDCAVSIGLQRRVASDAEIDYLVNLADDIVEALSAQVRLATMPTAVLIAIALEPAYSPEHLDEHRTFTSVITATYRVRRHA